MGQEQVSPQQEIGNNSNPRLLASSHKLTRRVKDPSFNIDELHDYTLSLMVGIRDFQLCITSQNSQLLLLEDYKIDGIRTVNERVAALKAIFENHHLLQAGFWKSIRLAVKTHKFTQVPTDHFVKDSAKDFLLVHCDINQHMEQVHYYPHSIADAVTVFATDARLIQWIESVYPNKKVTITHQGSALIEGVLKYDDHSANRTLFCYFDRGILHAISTENRHLIYYNQFAIKAPEDYLKYIMLVFKELGLSQKQSKLILWGNLKVNSKHVVYLKKYIRNISFGSRPSYLRYVFQFDEIPEHQYFDLMNVYLCE
ncbi:MAG: DUF3822 family protein [Cyclobacteriaceae bacterium]